MWAICFSDFSSENFVNDNKVYVNQGGGKKTDKINYRKPEELALLIIIQREVLRFYNEYLYAKRFTRQYARLDHDNTVV